MRLSFQKESAMDLRSLRFLVLWPHKTSMETCLMDVDFEESTQHFSLRNEGGEVLACCSLLAETANFFNQDIPVRLRAMSVHPDFRKHGLGKDLISQALDAYPTKSCWCDARVLAVPFYEKCGWRIASESFEIPEIGKHYKMIYNEKGGN